MTTPEATNPAGEPCPKCGERHMKSEYKEQTQRQKPGEGAPQAPDDVVCPCGAHLRHRVPIIATTPAGWCWMRVFETTIECCGHRVALRWWDIVGQVSNEDLEAEGETRVRDSLTRDYTSGELPHYYDDSSARGWWEIVRD